MSYRDPLPVTKPLKSLAGLLKLADRRARGPSPTFGTAHFLFAFMTIGEKGTIGRHALASHTGLGGGAVRTVIKKLREEGYAGANASGSFLTPAGSRVYDSVLRKLSPMVTLQGTQLTMGGFQVAVAIRSKGRLVLRGIEQRDWAIRVGAAGATTYVIRADKFTVPGGSSDCERDFPSKTWSALRSGLKPKNGDSVILCGAQDETTAKLGALSAAVTLL